MGVKRHLRSRKFWWCNDSGGQGGCKGPGLVWVKEMAGSKVVGSRSGGSIGSAGPRSRRLWGEGGYKKVNVK